MFGYGPGRSLVRDLVNNHGPRVCVNSICLQDGYYFGHASALGHLLGPWRRITNRFYVTGNAPTNMLTVMNA